MLCTEALQIHPLSSSEWEYPRISFSDGFVSNAMLSSCKSSEEDESASDFEFWTTTARKIENTEDELFFFRSNLLTFFHMDFEESRPVNGSSVPLEGSGKASVNGDSAQRNASLPSISSLIAAESVPEEEEEAPVVSCYVGFKKLFVGKKNRRNPRKQGRKGRDRVCVQPVLL